jgi:hypothetical protein
MNQSLYGYQKARGWDDEAEQTAQKMKQDLARKPVHQMRWEELADISDAQPQSGLALWEEIKEAARAELASGHRAAAMETYLSTPMDRARFVVLREALCEQWQPRGAGECLLLDQLAIAQTLFLHWTQTLSERAGSQGAHDRDEVHKIAVRERGGDIKGGWIAPRVSDAEAVTEAVQMVERWNRMYLRTLRQLRDLRRYVPPAPMTINNPGQVNIAAEGGQQVNFPPPDGPSPDDP